MHNRKLSHAVRSTLLRRIALGSTLAITSTLALADTVIVLNATGDNTTIASEIVTSSVISVNGDVVIAQSDSSTAPGTGQRIQRVESFRVPGGSDIDVTVSSALSQAFSSGGFSGSMGGKLVKNAPYSAELVNERVQTLPDGNQITKRTSQMSYRDSAGRTRSEVRNEAGEVRSITIFDAVDNSRLILSPQAKTATKLTINRDFAKRIEEIREKAKSAAKDGKATIIERSPGEEIVIHRREGPRSEGGQSINEEVKVRIYHSTGGKNSAASVAPPMPPMPPVPPGPPGSPNAPMVSLHGELASLGNLFQDRAWSSNATTKELGTKDFDGVRAEGKIRSYTIPAGEVGNKNPITVTTETWTSPELQITVYSKHSDPRAGDTIYRLSGVKRAEPPLSLFSIPDGYTVKEAPAMTFKSK